MRAEARSGMKNVKYIIEIHYDCGQEPVSIFFISNFICTYRTGGRYIGSIFRKPKQRIKRGTVRENRRI